MTDRIAITGATGYIGGRLAPRLLEAGYAIRCLARSTEKLRDREWAANPDVEIQSCDLNNVEALTANVRGCSAAFFLVHSMTSGGGDYAERDRTIAQNFAEAANRAGVERIIYLGGLGETGEGLSKHLASRREVEEALASAGVPVTVLRAAMIIGSGSASFEIVRYLVERLPVMITPKWVSTPCQPIAVRNVMAYLIGVLSRPETAGQTYDIGGPEVLSYMEIMRIMAEELHLPRRLIIPVPVLTPRLSSYWIHLITPLRSTIAQPLAEGLKNPVVCREDRITHAIPQQLLSVREAIRAALTKITERQVETNWSMAGPIPGDPDWAGGTVYRDTRSQEIDAPASAVFRAVCLLGGAHGWYGSDWLWRIRGRIDLFAGGPGLRRGRRDPENVGYGEAIDFWRVVGFERNHRLTLRAEMKLPGEALLEFCVLPKGPNACTLEQQAIFQPRGLFGILYWYSVLPFHNIVFSGMLHGIQRQALQIAARDRTTLAPATP